MVRKLVVVGAPAVLLALVALAGGPASAQEPKGGQAGGLPTATQRAARRLAERSQAFQGLLSEKEQQSLLGKPRDIEPGERVYFTKAEATTEKEDGSKPRDVDAAPRTVVLTYYRYKTDEAIVTTVNVATKEVLKMEHIPHLPTPLADDEVTLAKELALKDDQVQKVLQPYGNKVEVSVLVPQVGEGDKTKKFGHRLVLLMFRVGQDYLVSPRVLVDLTEQKVEVEKLKLPAGLDKPH
jgi:hypothetical protein